MLRKSQPTLSFQTIPIPSTSWAPNGYLLGVLGLGVPKCNQRHPTGPIGHRILIIYHICYLSLEFLVFQKTREIEYTPSDNQFDLNVTSLKFSSASWLTSLVTRSRLGTNNTIVDDDHLEVRNHFMEFGFRMRILTHTNIYRTEDGL